MRLAVSLAAWPEGASSALSSSLVALGFTVVRVSVGDLPGGIVHALAGLEPADTLLVHVGGVLAPDGAVHLAGGATMPLSTIADALAERPCLRSLVFVEAAYRGVEDALIAVEHVEAVADALSSNAGSHTTVVAVHPMGDAQPAGPDVRLGFTHAVLAAARDVVNPDGTALVADAYKRVREGELAFGPASGFAFLRGASPFVLAHALPQRAAAEAPAPASTSRPLTAPPPPVRPRALTPLPASRRISTPAIVAPPAPEPVRVATLSSAPPPPPPVPPPTLAAETRPFAPPAPAVPPPPLEHVEIPVVMSPEPPPVAPAATAGTSGMWVEMSDVIEAPSLEVLEARIAAANIAEDHRLLVELSRERLAHLKTPEARVDELFEIGRTLAGKLHDLPEAVLTLEEARGVDPSREDVLEVLRRSYARLDRWTEALEVTLALAKRTQDARHRAELRVAASEFAREHLDDEEYAIELLDLALGDDPGNEGAYATLAQLRRSRGELAELATTLAAVAAQLVDSGDGIRAWGACQQLASLRRDELGDAAGAVEALGLAKRLPLTELDSRAVLAEQLLALGDDEGAIAELEAIIGEQPQHVRAHARLFAVHQRRGTQDRAYLAALALEELGEVDAAVKEVLDAQRSGWGLRARASLDDAAWDLLRADGADEVIESVFRASLRAALAAEIENRAEGPVLDPGMRQPETSTATIVRCFQWAARALGTPSPALYVLDEVHGGIAAVSAAEPTTALGPEVLRGLSSKTLAFLAGRHLTYFRPEYQVLVHFPTTEAAAGLFFAAIDLVAPGTYVPPSMTMRVARAKYRLARHLHADELEQLSAAVGRMEARTEKVNLLAWIRSVELTAGRAGLMLAGDLSTALAQVRAESQGLTGLDVDERRNDLLAFASSRALADLRATYADTAPSSMRPPTVDSAVVHKDDPSLRPPSQRPPASRLMA